MSNYQNKFEFYVQRGDEAAQKGNSNKAIEYYKLALEAKPNDNSTLIKLGHAYCDQNDTEQGISCYLEASELDENDLWALYWLRKLLYYEG
jgi:tetratricopeptide (TPR) repeat protein